MTQLLATHLSCRDGSITRDSGLGTSSKVPGRLVHYPHVLHVFPPCYKTKHVKHVRDLLKFSRVARSLVW